MFRKALSVLLAVIVFAAVIPVAYADPTNWVSFSNASVHGGPSQVLTGNQLCTESVYCDYKITSLSLNGQSKLQFRPYHGDLVLLTSPKNFTTTNSSKQHLFYNANLNTLQPNDRLKLKFSIPSTNTNDTVSFSGSFWL